ncbi:MAG: YcxB family protein [Coriobacteriia bacterium]|nr:YcxB family protein [Coriobacteriia bacterium]
MSLRAPLQEDTGVSSEGVVDFNVTLTERGYRNVLLHLAALRLRFVPPALGMAAIFAYASGMRTEAIVLFAGGIAIPVVVWGYLAWLSGSPSSRALYAPVRYKLTGGGIAYSSAEGDGVLAWDGVERWREAAGHLLIYVSGSTYLLVPVDGLSPEVRDAVENALRDRVSPPGRRPRRLR